MCSHVWCVSGKVSVVVVPAGQRTKSRRVHSKGHLQKGPLGSKLEIAAGGASPPPGDRCQIRGARLTECVQAVRVCPTLDTSLTVIDLQPNLAAVQVCGGLGGQSRST